MAKIILICGKICSGKTTYAKKLAAERKAVRLNPDEIMIGLFGEQLGDRHEEILARTLDLLLCKSLEIFRTGIDVIIDFGFWQRHCREHTNAFFASNGVKPEWHYISVSDDDWKKNIEARNSLARKDGSFDYYVDGNILNKFMNPDDIPERAEMDIWFDNSRPLLTKDEDT